MGYDLNSKANPRSHILWPEVTPERRKRAVRNVCGSPHIRDAADAKLILDVLGLDPRETNADEESTAGNLQQ